TWQGHDPLGFVVAMNGVRRHLTVGQRAMIAAKIADLPKGRPVENGSSEPFSRPAIRQEQAAEALKVSVPTVKRAKRVLKHGGPELAKKVTDGEMTVSAAADLSREDPETQFEVLSRDTDAPPGRTRGNPRRRPAKRKANHKKARTLLHEMEWLLSE